MVGFTRKQVNRVAHCLAPASWYFASHRVFEYSPPCIIDLILTKWFEFVIVTIEGPSTTSMLISKSKKILFLYFMIIALFYKKKKN